MVFAGLCQRLGFAVAVRVDVCDVAGEGEGGGGRWGGSGGGRII